MNPRASLRIPFTIPRNLDAGKNVAKRNKKRSRERAGGNPGSFGSLEKLEGSWEEDPGAQGGRGGEGDQ